MANLLFLQNLEYEFLGPMYISAMAGKRHSCRLAIGKSINDFTKIIESFKPDVIGFSIMSGSHKWALNIARQVKSRHNSITLFGGAHPTFFPEFIEEDGVDLICRGEGEEAALDLLDSLDSGREIKSISNLYVKQKGKVFKNEVRPLKTDLDFYPFPDRKLYSSINFRTDRSIKNIITSRGCPFHCAFCFEDSMRELYKDKGQLVRVRSIDKVMEELLELKNKQGAKTIYFCDDVFGISKKWLYSFLELYKKEIGLEFICLVRADIVCSDDSYARELYQAGCRNVFFGIETGSELLRNGILKKNIKDQQIYQAAELLHRAGIKFRTYNIVGLPDEILNDAFSTVEMNIKIKTDYPWCSIFTPYPKTALANYACQKGYLDSNFNVNQIPSSFFSDSQLKIPEKKKIENLHKFFQTVVLWPWTFSPVKVLIKLPPNIIFRWWFGMIYFYVYWRSEKRGFLKTFFFALRNYWYLLKGV